MDIRRSILQVLYDKQKLNHHGSMERSQIVKELASTTDSVQSSLNYLVGKGFVDVIERTRGSRTFHFVKITTAGIDFLEGPSEFSKPQSVIQNIFGDNITVGDHASNVSVGKGINHIVQMGATTEDIDLVGEKFIQEFRGDVASNPDKAKMIKQHFQRLMEILSQEEIDLGEVQKIKREMSEIEGQPADQTALLFSYDAVANPIRRAFERLIGIIDGSNTNG